MRTSRYFTSVKEKIMQYFRFVVVIFMVILVMSLVGNIVSIRKAESKITEAEERVEKLKREREELEQELASIESSFYVEKQLRDNLGMSKENEIVLVLPEDTVLRKLAPVEKREEIESPQPNWKKWMDLFI